MDAPRCIWLAPATLPQWDGTQFASFRQLTWWSFFWNAGPIQISGTRPATATPRCMSRPSARRIRRPSYRLFWKVVLTLTWSTEKKRTLKTCSGGSQFMKWWTLFKTPASSVWHRRWSEKTAFHTVAYSLRPSPVSSTYIELKFQEDFVGSKSSLRKRCWISLLHTTINWERETTLWWWNVNQRTISMKRQKWMCMPVCSSKGYLDDTDNMWWFL